jgi:16S rRNA processing protein RimM
MSRAAATQRLVVGLVRGVHGLRGAVRVEILSDDPGRFANGSILYVEGSTDGLTVAWSQPDERGILVRFAELPTREDADTLRDRYLEADVESDSLADDAVYWHEVEGVPVLGTDGEELGTVQEVFRAGASEVYVVRGGPRGEIYVPAVKSVITEFAPREGRIVVDTDALGLDETRERRPRGRRTTRALKQARTIEANAADAPATDASDATEVTDPSPSGAPPPSQPPEA